VWFAGLQVPVFPPLRLQGVEVEEGEVEEGEVEEGGHSVRSLEPLPKLYAELPDGVSVEVVSVGVV